MTDLITKGDVLLEYIVNNSFVWVFNELPCILLLKDCHLG